MAICFIGLAQGSGERPQHIDKAFSAGLEWLTHGRLLVGRPEEVIAFFLGLIVLRRARLDWLAVTPGAIEVRPLENSGVQVDVDDNDLGRAEAHLRRLTAEFREYLSSARVYETTTVPGDLETDRIIEVFKSTQPSGRLATLAAVWSFIWPARAFIVTASLRRRPETPHCGVSVVVRRLPWGTVELDTQWSRDFERALQRAAFAVTAHILPSTRACRNPPWSQWHGRRIPMPMELMRHYQRAKRMVGERRYDEALSLYHNALLYDSDNFYIRYDIGQILERLQLYPDALIQYAEITERLFPVEPRPAAPQPGVVEPGHRKFRSYGWRAVQRRSAILTTPPIHHPVTRSSQKEFSRYGDAFLVRYRYLSALGTARRLSKELLNPEWFALQEWLQWQSKGGGATEPAEGRGHRPWRSVELSDLRRRLAEQLDPIWQEELAAVAILGGSRTDPPLGLAGVLLNEPHSDEPPAFVENLPSESSWRYLSPARARLLAVEQYFLAIADAETRLFLADFRRQARWRRAPSSLNKVTVQLMQTFVSYRMQRLQAELFQAANPGQRSTSWPPSREQVEIDLANAGYHESSRSWLQHYIVACFHALPLEEDSEEIPVHRPYAEAAVRALERAQSCGNDFEFVISKRYWLLAGDPDLAGLRRYECFSAFESRVYLHPQPSTPDSAKYELFHYLRQGLERGAQQMEQIWLQRAQSQSERPDGRMMESWFRAERRAWEICIRLGRFHRQWQTRSSALDSLRNLISEFGGEPVPVPYPEIIRDYMTIGVGIPDNVVSRLTGMERLFSYLATNLGNAAALDGHTESPENVSVVPPPTILDHTRSWIWYAEHCSRGEAVMPSADDMVDLCERQAAVWTALRHWVTTPARRDASAFTKAVQRVRPPAYIDLTEAEQDDRAITPPSQHG